MRLTLTRVGTPLENWRAAEKELTAIEQRIVDLGVQRSPSLETLRTVANLNRARIKASRTADRRWQLLLQDFAQNCAGRNRPAEHGADEEVEEILPLTRAATGQAMYLETVVRRMITNHADRRALRAELMAQATECDRRRHESTGSETQRENERQLSDRIRAILFFVRTGALAAGATEADIELCRLIQETEKKRTRSPNLAAE